jgi:hypothetical protein
MTDNTKANDEQAEKESEYLELPHPVYICYGDPDDLKPRKRTFWQRCADFIRGL